MSDVFSRFAPFIQDYIYRCKWEELREIQVLAAKAIFDTDENLLLSSDFASVLTQYQSDWRDVVSTAAQCGVAVPAFSASLSYYDGLCDPAGPLNLLQAQRDCFGAHTFRRIDRDGSFHHNW